MPSFWKRWGADLYSDMFYAFANHSEKLIQSNGLGGLRGAGDRTRTYDPIITNDVLYQLSYTGAGVRRLLAPPRGGGKGSIGLFFGLLRGFRGCRSGVDRVLSGGVPVIGCARLRGGGGGQVVRCPGVVADEEREHLGADRGRDLGLRRACASSACRSASQWVQTGTQSAWTVLQLSQIQAGPRGAVSARASQPRTTRSEAPSPRSIAAMIDSTRASGSFSGRSPMARRAPGKSSAARCSSAFRSLRLAVLGVDRGERAEALEALGRVFLGLDLGKGGGEIGMRLLLPGLLEDARGVLLAAVRDVAAGGHGSGRHEVGRALVGRDRGLAGLDRLALVEHVLGLGQGEDRVAALVHVAGQGAVFELGVERVARALPVVLAGLQAQEDVLRLLMLGLEGEGASRRAASRCRCRPRRAAGA